MLGKLQSVPIQRIPWEGHPFGVGRSPLDREKGRLVMKTIRYWQRLAFAKGIPSET